MFKINKLMIFLPVIGGLMYFLIKKYNKINNINLETPEVKIKSLTTLGGGKATLQIGDVVLSGKNITVDGKKVYVDGKKITDEKILKVFEKNN